MCLEINVPLLSTHVEAKITEPEEFGDQYVSVSEHISPEHELWGWGCGQRCALIWSLVRDKEYRLCLYIVFGAILAVESILVNRISCIYFPIQKLEILLHATNKPCELKKTCLSFFLCFFAHCLGMGMQRGIILLWPVAIILFLGAALFESHVYVQNLSFLNCIFQYISFLDRILTESINLKLYKVTG